MKNLNIFKVTLLLLLVSKASFSQDKFPKPDLKKQLSEYNIVWKEQSTSSAASMPLSGSKGFGANVWVQDGSIYLYLGSNNSYDENEDLLKLGCIRLQFTPNPFEQGTDFSQELDLYSGRIIITGKSEKGLQAKIWLWYGIDNAALYIQSETPEKTQMKVSFATWRTHADSVELNNYNFKGPSVVLPDKVEQHQGSLIWYHQNDNSKLVTKELIDKQRFEAHASSLDYVTKDLVFGGMVYGEGMESHEMDAVQWQQWNGNAWQLQSIKPEKNHFIVVVPQVAQVQDIEKWKNILKERTKSATSGVKTISDSSLKWWAGFWNRSYIFINPGADPADQGWQIGRNYQLFRYMLACNTGNRLPLKFNGGIFTTDPPEKSLISHNSDPYKIANKTTPDFRRWGNLFMAQNQRLIGWPSLASGDFDLVTPSLDFYADRLSVAERRSKLYWNHGGAAFPEPLDLCGLPVNRLASSDGPMAPKHLEYHFSMQIEFAYMAIQWARYSGNDLKPYLPFIYSVAKFYDEHYRKENLTRNGSAYDESGKLVLYPLNSLELYSEATDPVEVVAGLRKVTDEMLAFPSGVIPDSIRNWFEGFSHHIPEIGYETRNGVRVISPALKYGKVYNPSDFPEMYTVWPYGLLGVGEKQGFAEANNTWENLPENRKKALEFWSWMCTPVYAALLGRTQDAKRLMIEKLSDKNSNLRFPAFFGPGHDWIPDHNWGGSGMVGLQNMLLYSRMDKLYLFSAWPAEWNVVFKLHASGQTIVECDFKKGIVKHLQVTPREREKDLEILKGESKSKMK